MTVHDSTVAQTLDCKQTDSNLNPTSRFDEAGLRFKRRLHSVDSQMKSTRKHGMNGEPGNSQAIGQQPKTISMLKKGRNGKAETNCPKSFSTEERLNATYGCTWSINGNENAANKFRKKNMLKPRPKRMNLLSLPVNLTAKIL